MQTTPARLPRTRRIGLALNFLIALVGVWLAASDWSHGRIRPAVVILLFAVLPAQAGVRSLRRPHAPFPSSVSDLVVMVAFCMMGAATGLEVARVGLRPPHSGGGYFLLLLGTGALVAWSAILWTLAARYRRLRAPRHSNAAGRDGGMRWLRHPSP